MPSQSTEIRTFQDLIDFLEDASGLDQKKDGDMRRFRTAVDSAYKRLAGERTWTYYQQVGRINCNAAESSGTVSYDHEGGTYPRQLTLVGANWPTWAIQGTEYLAGVPYEIEDRKSNSIITLSPNSNPGADVASTAQHTIVRGSYPLPVNLKAINQLQDVNRVATPSYMPPAELLEYSRLQGGPSGRPLCYTVHGSSDYMGAKTLVLAPAPNAATVFDFYYEKWARPLRTQNESRGVVSGSQGAYTLTGSNGVNWPERIEGSIIRISGSQSIPSGTYGNNPCLMERVVMTRNSATSIELDAPLTEAVTRVGYCISDPLDIDVSVMWDALKACAEMLIPQHPARMSRWYKGGLEAAYHEAISAAARHDMPTTHRRDMMNAGGGMHAFTVSPGATMRI